MAVREGGGEEPDGERGGSERSDRRRGLGLTLTHEHFYSGDEAIAPTGRTFATTSASTSSPSSPPTRSSGTESRPWSSRPRCCSAATSPAAALADETGLQIVTCTGIYTYDHLPPYLVNRDEDFMAGLFVHDIEQGIQGTDIKAAFVKCRRR